MRVIGKRKGKEWKGKRGEASLGKRRKKTVAGIFKKAIKEVRKKKGTKFKIP